MAKQRREGVEEGKKERAEGEGEMSYQKISQKNAQDIFLGDWFSTLWITH